MSLKSSSADLKIRAILSDFHRSHHAIALEFSNSPAVQGSTLDVELARMHEICDTIKQKKSRHGVVKIVRRNSRDS
jgi:hypothetical protein